MRWNGNFINNKRKEIALLNAQYKIIKNLDILYYQNYFFIFSLIRSFIFFIKEIIIQSYVNKGVMYVDYFIKIKNNKELFSVFKVLSSSLLFSYDQLINLSCVDNLNLKSYNLLNRFTLVYVLNKINTGSRLILLIDFCEKQIISSISSIYKAANWLEREVFDLFGIFFSNHFDLRRILTDYGFKGFPLRKDFPLTGYIELRYSEEKKYVKYKRLLLMQEYRFFNFLSPWEQYVKKVI